jgi:integrase
MTQLDILTGARPGEIVIMRTADIDTSGPVWIYRPFTHKNTHRGQDRVIAIGPMAQEVLRPFLKPELEAFIFSPAEAEAERRAALHASRMTPLSYGNRPGTNRRGKPKRQPGARYDVGSWRQAIHRACGRVFPPPEDLPKEDLAAWRKAHRFNPGQLRHTAGTEARRQFGLDAAQVVLGHKHAAVTEIYAERNLEHAVRVALAIG